MDLLVRLLDPIVWVGRAIRDHRDFASRQQAAYMAAVAECSRGRSATDEPMKDNR